MSASLKIELAGLAEISRTLHHRERRAFDNAQLNRIHTRLAGEGVPLRAIGRIMKRASGRTIKIMSNPEVAIRRDGRMTVGMDKPEPGWIENSAAEGAVVHRFRTNELRKELRAGYLAYAFLRGVDLERVEKNGREPIPFDRIGWMVSQHTKEDTRIWTQRFEQWRAAAWNLARHPRPAIPTAGDAAHPDSISAKRFHDRMKRSGTPFPYDAIPR